MAARGTCALCGAHARLCKSHVVPKFAVKWLKKTSATGFLRKPLDPNVRRQDAERMRLFCQRCESLLSRDEKRFREVIFGPLHQRTADRFDYGPWLLRFAVSMGLRALLVHRPEVRRDAPELNQLVERMSGVWADFVLGRTRSPGEGGHHLVFLDVVDPRSPLPGAWHPNWWMVRSLELRMGIGGRVLVYAKLCRCLFVSHIDPPNPDGWLGTRVGQRGAIGLRQEVTDAEFRGFVVRNIHETHELFAAMSERQRELVGDAVLQNADRFVTSEAFAVMSADRLMEERDERTGVRIVPIDRETEGGPGREG